MPQKSTNVHTSNGTAHPLLRAGISVLAAASPGLAAAAVAPLMFKAPRRRAPSQAEQEVLDRAAPLAVGAGRHRIAAWRWGSGPVVLLAHGWGGGAGQLTPLVAPLLQAGYSVVAHDAPGHGRTPGQLASIPAFASAIARVAELVGPLHGVVAHSMGGAAFSLAAARGLTARRVVYLGPPCDALPWYTGFVRWLRYPPASEGLLRARAEAIAGERLDRLNATTLGPSLRAPLLVVHDRQDREVPLEDGARVAREAADGRLLVTDGLGHRRILRDPGVLAEVVRFLAAGLERDAAPAA